MLLNTVQQMCCYKCGGAHSASQCNAASLDCPNCKRSKITVRNHSARDLDCPIYIQRVPSLQQQTNYSSSENFK